MGKLGSKRESVGELCETKGRPVLIPELPNIRLSEKFSAFSSAEGVRNEEVILAEPSPRRAG